MLLRAFRNVACLPIAQHFSTNRSGGRRAGVVSTLIQPYISRDCTTEIMSATLVSPRDRTHEHEEATDAETCSRDSARPERR